MLPEKRIQQHLEFIYGREEANKIWPLLEARLAEFHHHHGEPASLTTGLFSEQDAILITYGDQVLEGERLPLQVLAEFLEKRLAGVVSGVHLLPFYPYSSDDGFSVIDYRQVDPHLGDWQDVARTGQHFRLMFDAVLNHISRESEWFEAFQRGEAPYSDYFITVDPSVDLSLVTRPRALPLLAPVETRTGLQHVWTTFSDDQIDLNYANPQVLLEIVDLLLFYVERGAEIIRLDAIAYLWKEIGTASIHLPKTHAVVKLLRAVLDAVEPKVILITETNVPHEDNIRYFGDLLPGSQRTDEAQMVYQFPLAPLVLHTFHTGSARAISRWVKSLAAPAPGTTFFNFIASHDGIGVMPARGLLTENEIQALVDRAQRHGGLVSYRNNPDGSKSVYELNITLFDMLNAPACPQPELDIRRFVASQAIMLSLAGVPGIYVHSFFGSRNCEACVEKTGRARSINREKFNRVVLEARLVNPASLPAQVFSRMTNLLRQRRSHSAFHPSGAQQVLDLGEPIFALARTSPDGQETVLCLVNISSERQLIHCEPGNWGLPAAPAWRDLVGEGVYPCEGGTLSHTLHGYQVVWLMPTAGD